MNEILAVGGIAYTIFSWVVIAMTILLVIVSIPMWVALAGYFWEFVTDVAKDIRDL